MHKVHIEYWSMGPENTPIINESFNTPDEALNYLVGVIGAGPIIITRMELD